VRLALQIPIVNPVTPFQAFLRDATSESYNKDPSVILIKNINYVGAVVTSPIKNAATLGFNEW
jgi:hypothetical protein